MRYPIAFALMLFGLIANSQVKNSEFGMGYTFSSPQGTMKENIQYANGLHMDFYFNPGEKRYALGMELAVNMYGHDKTRQTYTLDDGSTAPMDIVVNNNFFNVMVGGRYYLRQGNWQPFVTGKLGYSFYSTDLNIYDPDDKDHCEPVENDVLKKDGSLIFSAGAGLRCDLLPKKNPGVLFLNVSANYTAGGKVNYMNVDGPTHSHTAHTSDVYAKFINTQTQIVHEHHVGNVYSSLIELMDFRLGFSVRLQNRTRF
jgi:hypothetical protein